jgi:uncharacterized membrane protein YwzB
MDQRPQSFNKSRCLKDPQVKRPHSELLRVLIFLVAVLLCVLVTRLIWPGSTVGDQFYSYPVTAPLIAVVAGVWVLILGVTFWVMRRMKKG